MNVVARGLFAVTLVALVALPTAAQAAVVRVAVVVGANAAPPGRAPLLFGHRDAEKVAAALVSVGGFPAADVEVLRDPSGPALLGALGRAVAKVEGQPQSLLYFYYSGHSDERAVYPGGQAVALDKLRAVMDRARVSVRIGMVDACRGGAWTRAKGLSAEAPFAVQLPVSLDNEGSVLISSSSGLESAHESDQLQGSFFTHHFVIGLRGGADRDGDRQVTLTEAFDYAKERTIRDSLRVAREAQHPSYAVNLRGRRDLVLATVDVGPEGSTLELAQKRGPLELIHAGSGVSLLELPAGARQVRLAVPPGRYLIRRLLPTPLVKEVRVDQGQITRVEEDELALVGSAQLSIKGSDAAPPAAPMALVATSPAPATTPVWVKASTYTSAALALGAWALFVKYRLDVATYDQRLDPFRRYPCPQSPTGLCNKDYNPADLLTPAQEDFVAAEMKDRNDFNRYSYMALGTAAALTVTSGLFLYKWYRSGQDAEPTLTVVPTGQLGLGAVGRF
jgi:hypothetical protein